MAILIPEQISYLRKKKSEILDHLTSLGYSVKGGVIVPPAVDYSREYGEQPNKNEVNEYSNICKLLTTSKFLDTYRLDKVSIGTKFLVKFSDEELEEEMTLVEEGYGLTSTDGFVSCNSPFGKSIIDKGNGDTFSYEVCSNTSSIKITGRVESIINDSKKYIEFLRDEENVSANEITLSQKELLEEELERLKYTGNNKERINFIDELLNKAIINKGLDKNIGIGSKFTLGLDNEALTFELIERAVSTELDSDYIERYSEIGEKIYGLNVNDSFTLDSEDYGPVSIKVLEIKNKR